MQFVNFMVGVFVYIHSVLLYIFNMNSSSDADYSTPTPERSINEHGAQTTKIFFRPRLYLADSEGTREISTDWAGRILPGQTISEGIATELKEVYGYAGKFDYGDIHFLDYSHDRKGNNIERYSITITLHLNEGNAQDQSDTAERPDQLVVAIVQEYDGDPTDFDSLDEIAHDYLLNDLSSADAARNKHAAEAVKAKIRVLENQMRKLDPSYTYSIDEPMQLSDWNPPRNASAENFYEEFEYHFGNSRLDEAVSLYARFHPDESVDNVRGRMRRVAERLEPNG